MEKGLVRCNRRYVRTQDLGVGVLWVFKFLCLCPAVPVISLGRREYLPPYVQIDAAARKDTILRSIRYLGS